MQLVMVRWCAVTGADRCWVVLWIPIEDYGCITSLAQSTAATHFIFAVKSDVVHLIVVCWALCCSLSELNSLFTLGGQQKYLFMLV